MLQILYESCQHERIHGNEGLFIIYILIHMNRFNVKKKSLQNKQIRQYYNMYNVRMHMYCIQFKDIYQHVKFFI